MNFYKRYPADYGKKTARLTLAEHGAYTLLLDELYSTEAGLPDDFDELYRVCRAMTKPEQVAVRKVAELFFVVGADGLRHNRRATAELIEAAPALEAARLNGKKGGRPKKEPTGLLVGNPEGTQKEPNSKPPHSSDTSPSLRSGDVAHLALGITAKVLSDYLAVRKAKKAGPLTDTAIAGLQREADRAGITLGEAITACCEFSWTGFNADWYAERKAKSPRAAQPFRYAHEHKHAAAGRAIFDDEETGVIDV